MWHAITFFFTFTFLPNFYIYCFPLSLVKNNYVEIQMDDLQTFDALERDVRKVEAAVKLFSK